MILFLSKSSQHYSADPTGGMSSFCPVLTAGGSVSATSTVPNVVSSLKGTAATSSSVSSASSSSSLSNVNETQDNLETTTNASLQSMKLSHNKQQLNQQSASNKLIEVSEESLTRLNLNISI